MSSESCWLRYCWPGARRTTRTQTAEHQTAYDKPLTSPGAKFGALPPVVQRTVLAEAGPAEVVDAVRDTSSGRVVYKIYFRDKDLFPPLYVAPDGSVLNPDLTVAVSTSAWNSGQDRRGAGQREEGDSGARAGGRGCLHQHGNLGWPRRFTSSPSKTRRTTRSCSSAEDGSVVDETP